MRYFIRSAALTCAVCLATVSALPSAVSAASATAGPGGAARAAASAGTAPAASTGTALLINGDKITLIGTGRGQRVGAVALAGTSLASTLVSLTIGGASYEVPADALPFLGRGLSPDLFDVGSLLRAETNGRLPLQLHYQGHLPALPGLTITRRAAGSAEGYLTSQSARAFGAALARRYLADRGGSRYGLDGGLADGVTISLAGAAPAPARQATGAARAQAVTGTLTITGTNLAGQPDQGGAVYLVNVDNSAITGDPSETGGVFQDGSAKFSVPAGHYFVLADFLDLSARGALAAERVVALPQITVSGTNTTVHMDERAADSKVTIVTPRPATVQATELELARVPRAGSPMVFGFFDAAPVTTWVAPARKRVTVGGLRTYLDAWLTSARKAAPYEYDLAFQGRRGLIPQQRHVVNPSSLATLDARYYSPVPASAFLLRTGMFSFQIQHALPPIVQSVQQLEPYIPLHLPQHRTEYTSAGPSLVWESLLVPSDGPPYPLTQYATARVYQSGKRVTENWNADPLHPGVDVNLTGTSFDDIGLAVPSASRAGDTLTLLVTPFSDNVPGHLGYGYGVFPAGTAVSGTYEVDQNKVKIASGNAAGGGAGGFETQVNLSPDPSVVTFVLRASRTGPSYPLSTRTATRWTWRSSHEAGAALPASWQCPAGDQDCTVEPMMTLRYAVARLRLDGSARPGAQRLDISAGHLQLAAAAKITGVRVQVSFNDAATWHRATVTGHDGSYQARYVAPASASYVTLRVTATDGAGGQISETITRAYRIAE